MGCKMFKKNKHEKVENYKKMLNKEDPFDKQSLEPDKERAFFFKMKKRLNYNIKEYKE